MILWQLLPCQQSLAALWEARPLDSAGNWFLAPMWSPVSRPWAIPPTCPFPPPPEPGPSVSPACSLSLPPPATAAPSGHRCLLQGHADFGGSISTGLHRAPLASCPRLPKRSCVVHPPREWGCSLRPPLASGSQMEKKLPPLSQKTVLRHFS